jgi:hypothetical protein
MLDKKYIVSSSPNIGNIILGHVRGKRYVHRMVAAHSSPLSDVSTLKQFSTIPVAWFDSESMGLSRTMLGIEVESSVFDLIVGFMEARFVKSNSFFIFEICRWETGHQQVLPAQFWCQKS